MKWLERLKSENTPDAHATKPTKVLQGEQEASFVGSVASPLAPFPIIEAPGTIPANDPQVAPALPLGGDPDRWCWPHSGAMHRGEIDTFMARLALFTGKGKSLEEAERLADKLVTRDREGDDRRSCLECTHLHGTGRRRCSQAQWTGDASVGVPAEQSNMLQRCNGFKAALPGQSPSPSAR